MLTIQQIKDFFTECGYPLGNGSCGYDYHNGRVIFSTSQSVIPQERGLFHKEEIIMSGLQFMSKDVDISEADIVAFLEGKTIDSIQRVVTHPGDVFMPYTVNCPICGRYIPVGKRASHRDESKDRGVPASLR